MAVALSAGLSTLYADSISSHPSLIIGITVDGLSIEQIDRLKSQFKSNGFNYFLNNGVTITDLEFGTPLDAAAAEAVLQTGGSANINGVSGRCVYNPTTHRVLPLLNSDSPSAADENFSPTRLLSSTIGDELKISTDGKSLIHSISPDASIAVISAGHTGNSAYWINDVSGKWTTSTFYPDKPSIVQNRNRMRPISAVLDTLKWSSSKETKGMGYFLRFPKNRKDRYIDYKATPLVNVQITDLAIDLLRNSDIGADEVPDMLSLSYTLQPFHRDPGVNYNELLTEGYIELDKELARLIEVVEENTKLENTLIYLAGTPVTSRSPREHDRWRIPSGNFYPDRAISLLNLYLINKFGNADWVRGYYDGYFYLNPLAISEHDTNSREVRLEAAAFLRRMAGVAGAYSVDDVVTGNVHGNGDAIARNTRLDTVGDIKVDVLPGWHIVVSDLQEDSYNMVERSGNSTAPAFIVARDLEPEIIITPVDARCFAPTISSLLRIRPPNGSSVPSLRLK